MSEIQRKYYKANREKRTEAVRQWRAANPDRTRDTLNKWRALNPEKVSAYNRKAREANPEKVRECTRKWRKNNPDRARESARVSRAARYDKFKEWHCKYKEANPDKIREWKKTSEHRRRLLLTNARCDLTLEQWQQIKAFYKYRCALCGKKKPLTQDHIVPVSKGGEHTASNIMPLCRECNSSKGNREIKKTFQPHLLMTVEADAA